MKIIKPYNDEYLIYDKTKHRYILTVDYVEKVLGVDLKARLSANNTINATTVINSFLDNASSEVYNYLYAHNNTQHVQFVVAVMPSARNIIKEAMGKQALYMIYNGDMGFSTKKEEQEVSLNKYAREILDNQDVVEVGFTLAYTGRYPFYPLSYAEGEY